LIIGGRATWILRVESDTGRPLAVLAQQWSQPRLLVEADAAVSDYIRHLANPHLYLQYWCQVAPERVFDSLAQVTRCQTSMADSYSHKPQPPNKAPEPTTFAVTSRAIVPSAEGRLRNVRRRAARDAPAKVVAHL
jgi:hypothetical protein